jgi:hypothetical protein
MDVDLDFERKGSRKYIPYINRFSPIEEQSHFSMLEYTIHE